MTKANKTASGLVLCLLAILAGVAAMVTAEPAKQDQHRFQVVSTSFVGPNADVVVLKDTAAVNSCYAVFVHLQGSATLGQVGCQP